MKNFYHFFLFFGLLIAMDLQGQNNTAVPEAEAVQAAALDPDVDMKQDLQTGRISFVRKERCPDSGKEILSEVEYCSRSAKFINVTPQAKTSCNRAGLLSASEMPVVNAFQPAQTRGPSDAAKKAACSGAISKVRLVKQN